MTADSNTDKHIHRHTDCNTFTTSRAK